MAADRTGIFIALGANLPSARFGAPRDTLRAALAMLKAEGVTVLHCSSWWQSGAQPASDQPDYINAVAEVECQLDPKALLARLHAIEAACGRVRRQQWEARSLDLDLIAYHRIVAAGGTPGEPVLPHPRLAERLFVLRPLQEIAPDWRHPVSGQTLETLMAGAISININKL